MANNSLLILDSFTFTLESLKYAEASKHFYEQLGQRRIDGGGESEKCLSSKSPPFKKASSPTISSSSAPEATKSNGAPSEASLHESKKQIEPANSKPPNESELSLSSLSQQISKAREQIQSSLQGINSNSSTIGCGAFTEEDLAMREENTKLKKQVDDLENQVKQLKDRVTKLEATVNKGGFTPAPTAPVKSSGDNKKAEDDDVDLFGSDEEDDDAVKVREQRLAEYAAKKSKKPALVAKSNVILDVKPWDDETKMEDLEKAVRTIEMDGLLWGASKLVPLAYGIKKLQIATVIEDDKVSVDELTEKIEAFEDFVQSVDIAAFNKI